VLGAAHAVSITAVRFDTPGPRTLNGVQPCDYVSVRLGISVRVGGGGLIRDSEERV
jgi:hypothetical protein